MANHFYKLLSTVSVLPALLVLPAFADPANTSGFAFVFGDVAISNQSTIDDTAFGGRRMEWTVVGQDPVTGEYIEKYRNEFPNYQMVGRSFSLTNSVAYVGPVTLTLGELTEDNHLAYNWADSGVDTDLAARAGVDFGNTPEEIYAAVVGVIGAENAAYTAPGVIAFANRDSSATAGLLSFDSVTAVVDGATVNADAISVTNGSTLTFVNQDPSLLAGAERFYTNPEDIASTGVTTLNARTINIDGSRMIINQGAELIVNADEGATFQNSTVTGTGGAIYNQGSVTLNNATFGGIDNTDPIHPISLGNTASGRGGAIYSTGALTINDSFFIGNSSTGGDGGAIAIKADDAPALSSITNTSFIGNTALGTVDSDSGAISVINGDLTISGSTFTDNQAKTGGALYAYKGGATTNSYVKVTISNSTFSGNQATGNNNANSGGGAIGNVALNYRNDGDAGMWISNTLFENNASTISNVNGGGAIFAGSESRTNISNNTRFIGNNSASSGGAIGTRNFNFGENHSAVMDITGATFTGNTAATTGGAIDNNFYNSDTMTGFVYINSSLFGSNTAANGGAIYNHISQVGDANQGQIGSMYFEDTNFTNNTALANGGAIYNEGVVVVVANDADVLFSGNTANGNANDIYNAGGLTLTATNGQIISLEGGIDGASGTLNINGAGTVNIANALKNQTVTHVNGELHLYDADLTGSTIAVSSGATLNTIDGLINNYMSAITLADGAYIMGDIDLTGSGLADTYSAVNGANITYTIANALGLPDLAQAVSPKTIQVTNTGATVNAGVDFHWYDSVNGLLLTSGGEGTGSIVVQGFSGGINAAVDVADSDPTVHHEIAYSVTADEIFNGTDNVIQNTDFVITGNGTGDGSHTLTLAGDLVVDGDSSLSITDAILAQANDTEKIENRLGAVLNINNSFIGVDIDNAGILLSDPTTYTATVTNTGTASFDADTFDTTAVLANSGVVNLENGVEFNSGATITGNGIINLVSGTTLFNNTASSNMINLASGADFDGVLASTGVVNTQNNQIDDVTGSVTGGTLNVDASLIGSGTVDTFVDATGATIGSINLISSEYGDAQSLTLNVNGAALSDDLEITGATNYYTSIALDDSGNLVFSDKLLNTSGFYDLLGADWSNGHYILNAADYDDVADSTHLTVGQALAALDSTIGDMSEFEDDNHYATSTSSVATNLAALDAMVYSNASSISGLDTTIGDMSGFDDNNYYATSTTSVAANLAALDAMVHSNASAIASINEIGAGDVSNGAHFVVYNGVNNAAEMAAVTTGSDGYYVNMVETDSTDHITSLSASYFADAGDDDPTNSATISLGISDDENHTSVVDITGDTVNIAGATTITGDTTISGDLSAGATSVSSLTMGGTTVDGIDTTVANGSDNLITSGAVYSAINDKQDVIDENNMLSSDYISGLSAAATTDIDTTVTANSDNLITSGAVASAITDAVSGLQEAITSDNQLDASLIATDETHQFVTQSQIDAWSALTGNGEGSISSQIQTALNESGFVGSDDVASAVASGAETATYTANDDSHTDGTIGAAIDQHTVSISQNTSDIAEINSALGRPADENNGSTGVFASIDNINNTIGHASDDNNEATGLYAYVDNTVSNQIAALALSNVTLEEMAERDALTLSQANAYTDNRVETLDKNLSSGIASAVALSSVAVGGVRRGEMSVGAGYGYFNGQSAAAFGAAVGLSSRWSINAGAGISGYDVSFRAGTNFKFKVF